MNIELHSDGIEYLAAKLTKRQRAVLKLISNGQTNKEIAHELGVTVGTVKNYVAVMIRQSGFANRVQIARWAWFYPKLFAGKREPLNLHLHPCHCGRTRCQIMLAMEAPVPLVPSEVAV